MRNTDTSDGPLEKVIKLLNDKKAVQSPDIPTKLINEFCDFLSKFTYKSINHCTCFITDFRETKVYPLYKNDGIADKSNYRPINIVSNVSTIYDRSFYG